MKLRIGFMDYVVRAFRKDETEQENRWGDMTATRQEIRIFAGATPERQLAVLIHEIMHACIEGNGLQGRNYSEEQLCTFVGCAMAGVIINNLDLLPTLLCLAQGGKFLEET